MSDYGPERGTDRWREQVETVCSVLRYATSKRELESVSFDFVMDVRYSRGAITQAMHDVEIEKGWH